MQLAQSFAVEAGLSDLQPLTSGLEFNVYKATSPAHGAVVLRVPKSKVFQNANDPNVDACALVRQEVAIVELLRAATSVPVPQCHGYYEIDGHPAMVSEYKPGGDDDASTDGDDADDVDVALGRVAALIHATPVPADWPVTLVAMEGCTSEELPVLFVRRIRRRFDVLGSLIPQTRDWALDDATLRAVAEPLLGRQSTPAAALLHMDMRRANVRVSADRHVVSAVFDWTNALLGPPVVDVYRSLEWGARATPFLAGYASVRALEPMSPREEAFLRLDAALVLALVFASEAPDPERQAGALQRVQELCEALRQ